LRQAYDYWQNQPGNYLAGRGPGTSGRGRDLYPGGSGNHDAILAPEKEVRTEVVVGMVGTDLPKKGRVRPATAPSPL